MSLSDLSIKNPVFAVMLSAAMIVFGYLGYRDMGVSQFPEIDFPVVSVVITREAASPENVEADVTDFVEDAVSGVEGVDYIMSESLEGTSIVTVFFRLERNIDVAMQDVQNAVSAAMNRLPAKATEHLPRKKDGSINAYGLGIAAQHATKFNRNDLIEAIEAEINVLQAFLPKAMPAEELRALVQAAISETGAASPTDMGKVMKTVMPKVAGRAPNDMVSATVRELLQK